MRKEIVLEVRLAYDEEAMVWYVAESDVPGLCTEAATVPALIERVNRMVPELIEMNAHHLPGAPAERDFMLRQVFDTPVHLHA